MRWWRAVVSSSVALPVGMSPECWRLVNELRSSDIEPLTEVRVGEGGDLGSELLNPQTRVARMAQLEVLRHARRARPSDCSRLLLPGCREMYESCWCWS